MYAPRLPGHGTNPTDLAEVSASDLLDFSEKQYSRLNRRYETLVVGGFSMGGTIATHLADARQPDGLVLISPFFRLTYKPYYILPPEWWHTILSPFLNSLPAAKAVNRPGADAELTVYDEMPIPATRQLFALRDHVIDGLGQNPPRCPVLLVYSENDEVASPGAMLEVFEELSSETRREARFTRSNHHILSDWDRHGAVQAVLDFLQSL